MSIRITLTPVNHSVDFEVGSPEEGIAFVTEKGAALTALLDVLDRLPKGDTALVSGVVELGETPKERKPRGPNKPKADAVAPAPLTVPGAAPPNPPVPPSAAVSAVPTPVTNGITDPLAIPPMLQRDASNASPAIPAPTPPPPPAPPAPPAVPPTGVLAEKIIANLDARAKGTPDGGQSIADWLAGPGCGITIKGASYAEAIAVIRMTADAKLEPLLPALGL